MKKISILTCRILYKFLSKFGRGSSLPGKVASKLCKNILTKIKLPEKIVVVTGSSGKGSTTKIIAQALRDNNFKVCHNKEGGNQTDGITTALLKDTKLNGKPKCDIAVLEMDERSVKYLLPIIKPTDMIITNITRDQPPRQKHVDFIYQEIEKGLNTDIHLYLNANDPILLRYNLENKYEVTYYSVNKTKESYKKNIFNSLNYPRCPKCNNKLEYNFYHFEDLGDFKCNKCDFKTPSTKYKVTKVEKEEKSITINDKYKIKLGNDMLYNIYNTLAAYTFLAELSIPEDKISKSISKLNENTKVFSKYKYKGRKVYVLNNKCENATTYNQSMLYALNDKEEKTIVLGWKEISRRYLWDELSWLYDIEFETFKKQKIDKIIVAGPQRYDLAVRLKYANIDEKKIVICKDMPSSKDAIKNSKGNIYAILNFDYLDDFNKVMEELK